jgi:hypothetical protein
MNTATTPTDTSMLPRSITTKLLSLSTHDLYDDKFLGVEVALHDDLFMQQPPSRDMNSTGVVIGGGYHGARNPLHRRSHSTSEVDQNQNQILYHRSNSNSNSNYSKLEDGDIIEIIVWEQRMTPLQQSQSTQSQDQHQHQQQQQQQQDYQQHYHQQQASPFNRPSQSTPNTPIRNNHNHYSSSNDNDFNMSMGGGPPLPQQFASTSSNNALFSKTKLNQKQSVMNDSRKQLLPQQQQHQQQQHHRQQHQQQPYSQSQNVLDSLHKSHIIKTKFIMSVTKKSLETQLNKSRIKISIMKEGMIVIMKV